MPENPNTNGNTFLSSCELDSLVNSSNSSSENQKRILKELGIFYGENFPEPGINPITSEDYADYLSSFNLPTLNVLKNYKNAYVSEVLYGNYMIFHIPKIQHRNAQSEAEIEILGEIAKNCALIEENPMLSDAGITELKQQPYLNLTGRGVIIGVIDTGIDYRLPEFQFADGTTKILNLWDQTIDENPANNFNPPNGFYYGTEFSSEDINRAITSDNPLEIVPSVDELGHGTFLTTVACANAKNPNDYEGAAPDSEIIAVKLKPSKKIIREDEAIFDENVPAFQTTDIVAAIEYIFEKSVTLNKPVVIGISLGSNFGSHKGTTFFERYIAYISQVSGVGILAAVGNEGNKSHHFFKNLTDDSQQDVEISVAEGTKGFSINIWSNPPDRVSFSLITPLGAKIERRPFTTNDNIFYDFVLEKSEITITYTFPTLKCGAQSTVINFKNPTPGLWILKIYGDLILDGRIHGWMSITPFAPNETRFLQAEILNTITLPSTAENVVPVGGYNSTEDSFYVASGRGLALSGKQCPVFVAPAVDVPGIYPNNQPGTMTGTSTACAISTGAAALIMQWGIVDGNDKIINSPRLQSYLLIGARKRPGIRYPSTTWGYGELYLIDTFRNIR